jgi:hypothetical protein
MYNFPLDSAKWRAALDANACVKVSRERETGCDRCWWTGDRWEQQETDDDEFVLG